MMKERFSKRGKIKRALAMILVFVMTLSLANGVMLFNFDKNVKAASNPYPTTQNVDGDRYYEVPCTRFAWQEVYNKHKIALPAWGNAKQWYNAAKSNKNFSVGSTPKAGSIAVWSDNGYGHVAYVTSGSGSTFTVNEGGRTDLDHTASHGVAYGYTMRNHPAGSRRPYSTHQTLLGFIYLKANNNAYTPEGYLDAAAGGKGIVSVSGWALDRDKKDAKITVHIYIGGPAGTKGAESHAIVANKTRTDVHKATGCGNYHGFSATISTNKLGSQKVYAYGINIDKNGKGGGSNFPALKNTKTVNIQKKIDYKINTNVATEIKNKDALISGTISDGGKATKWGFYCGTDSGNMTKYTVSTTSSSSSTISTKVSPYATLMHGTTYYYKMWAVVDGKEITDDSPKSFTTTSLKPEIPTLKVASGSQEIGIESAATVNWSEVDNADYYILKLYNSEGELVHESDKVTGTKYAYPSAEEAGEYKCTISAYSDVGTKGDSETVSYIVHPDVKVIFKDADSFVDVGDDYEPATISEQDVHWGCDAIKPTDPEHNGYTFKEWNTDYSKVKENTTVKAVYEINKYTVKYVNSLTKEVLDTKTVEYYSAAPDVEYEVESGYKRIGFEGWDKDHSRITEDTILYTCVGWYNDNFSVVTSIETAVREYDANESDNEGYTIVAKVKSNPDKTAKGRLVVALKTSQGKLLTSTESSAFSIKKDSTKSLEVFVPYNKAAKKVEVFVVNQYGLAIPISNSITKEIDQSQMFTNWSTEKPNEDEVEQLQSRTEYRYSDKDVVKSYDSSLEGYTLDSSAWVQSGSGTINYVSSFPSGFNKSSSLYTQYNKKPVTAYENTTDKRTVSTGTAGYLYWHWCRGYTGGPTNRLVADCRESNYTTWHGFFSTSAIGFDSNCKAFYRSGGAGCKDSYWWISMYCNNSTQLAVKKCTYTDYKKQYTHYKWKDFSDWSTNEYTASDTRRVEDRKVYRYIDPDHMQEDNSGKERTVEGTLGSSFAGKEATLFIYKVDEASDYTNEYVAQTVLDEDGNYSFDFKLREEPTVKTGDYTITLGVEGGSTPLYVGTIEAPKNEYRVRFFNSEGEVISTQTVTEGENAEIPDEELYEKKGYTFTRWSTTNVNIKADTDIYPEYKINKYNVVFVDWAANSVQVEEFEYGAPLVTPLADVPEEGKTVSWEILSGIEDGDDKEINDATTVTNNLVVGTVYTDKEYQVQIQDENNRVIDTKNVKHGKAVTLPEEEENDNKVFLGWENVADGEEEGIDNSIVTDNMIVCPVYVYTSTTKNPTASVKTGVYDSAQTIELSTDTVGASIYYTLDGEDPMTANGILYEGPITINSSTELKFYAAKVGMNNSEVQTEYYSVNLPNAKSKWLTYEQLPEYVIENMDDYSVESDEGYSYKDIKTTTSLSEAALWEDAGWIKDGSLDTFTDYTSWQNGKLDNSDYIEAIEDTRPVYEEKSVFKYSHFKYIENDKTIYSRTAVEGKECEEESITFNNKLKISGFEDGKPYYVYDGQTWYNQEEVVDQVQIDTQYRYKYKKVNYYKWSDYSTEKPSIDENREYKKDDVYCYELNNKYLVTIVFSDGTKTFDLVDDNSTFNGCNTDRLLEKGKIVSGLYTDSDLNTEFDLETEIKDDITLYAKVDSVSYEVVFQYNDEDIIDRQIIEYGNSATPPEVEQRAGYRFVGWDTDSYKEVTDFVTATAKYVKEEDYATVRLDNEAVTLYQDKSIDLTASVTPNSYDGGLTWESSDTSVASVSEDGKVTAHNAGIANITVKVNETGETSTCKVSVKTDINSKIVLLKNSKLRIDDNGFLREVRAGSNTVAEVTNDFENDSLIVKDAEGNVLEDSDVVGTGAIIYLMKGKNVVDQMEVVVVGDTTGDGNVNNRDVSKLIRCLIDKEVPTDAQILAGDVNGDGYFNNRDAALIARSLVGKEVL